MNPLRRHGYTTRAMKKHTMHHWLNDFILYSLTALVCTSFCSSPLWYPPFCATFNVFFFLSLPKIILFFFTSKASFIMGNLIVIFLLGDSKFFASKYDAYDDSYYDMYKCKRLDQLQVLPPSHEHKGKKIIEGNVKQETPVKLLESKACGDNVHEEFFELYNDDETCESDAKQMVQSLRYDAVDLDCLEHEKKKVEEEKHQDIEGDGGESFPAEELNKLVDDFIAKINRQRRLEAEFCRD